jgi:hypothetical protein
VILSALPVLFLLVDGLGKLARIAPVLESFAALGYPEHLARSIGLLELACLAVYLSPRTGALGAVLLTGYLGGAVATHVRIGNPAATHVLFPIYIGVLLWAGLALRDRRVRAWLPVRIRG